jgi:recombination protein RecT
MDGNWVSKKLVQYMPMVYGLRKKILQARDANGKPIVSALQVGVVYKAEVERLFPLGARLRSGGPTSADARYH